LSHTSELAEFPAGQSFVAAAEEAVTRAGDAVTDMKYFGARDGKPADYCMAQIRESDVYVGLIGLRYGSPVADRQDVSYTEFEFQAATEAGIPRLIFLLDENAALPIPAARLFDTDPGRQAKQREFRGRLRTTGLMSRKVATAEQLEIELLQALQASRPVAADETAQGPGGTLPGAPDLVGRVDEVATLVASWLANPPQPVAVLGAPGIGKSTICLAALHDEQVAGRFAGRRWFVRCDGAPTADGLHAVLAAEIGVTGDGPPGSLPGRVVTVLGSAPAVVVLDNFETPWTGDTLATEQLLRTVAAIPGLALAVTARGSARPSGPHWRDFAMLSPLPQADARRLFLTVAGTQFTGDPALTELLAGLDGVPLAVELLGYAAQGQPALDQVATRWRSERTAMLKRMGGLSPQLSVAVSVETSITSPLMTSQALRLLTLLGVLPDGISGQDLASLAPEDGLPGAAVLRQLGLAFDEGPRLRMLAPIRDHAETAHPPAAADLELVVSYYAGLAASTGDQVGRPNGAEAAARLQAETGNIGAMLKRAAAGSRTSDLADALAGLAEYWRFTGFTQDDLASMLEDEIATRGVQAERARTWLAIADLALARAEHDTASDRYQRALPLYQQASDLLGQANCIKGLGDIAQARTDLDTARDNYQRAQAMYEETGSILGQANCIQRLGGIAQARADYAAARQHYEQAMPLYEQTDSILGQANCIEGLADVAQQSGDPAAASGHYQQALQMYVQTGSILGQANCVKGLGDIAQDRSDFGTAVDNYQRAQAMYRQADSVLGQANCVQSMGDIALTHGDQAGCRDNYQRALAMYQSIDGHYSVGWTLVKLTRLDQPGPERDQHWQQAREAWLVINRADLIDLVKAEFE
jgi:tetratricopeptide (TPR) repeat protein